MKFELYINNHEHQKGIEDYILSIKNIFSKNNIKINALLNQFQKMWKSYLLLKTLQNFQKNF